MNIVTKYKTKRTITNLADALFETNIYYIILSLSAYKIDYFTRNLKNIYMDVLEKHFYNNINKNKTKLECIICYDTTNLKYKMPCCDKQYLCLKCLGTMYNIKQFKCLYCRNSLYKDEIIEVSRLISNHYMFKIHIICKYFYNFGYIQHIKTIKKIDNNNFFIKLDNNNKIHINYNNNGDINWYLSYKIVQNNSYNLNSPKLDCIELNLKIEILKMIKM